MATEARVPNSQAKDGWSIETAIDHLLALESSHRAGDASLAIAEIKRIDTLIAGNDRRYEERFNASQKALELGLAGQKSEISAALAASDRAVLKAEVATEKRFESVNEFRGTLDNQQRTLIPRSEVDVMVRGLEEKINASVKIADAQQVVLSNMAAERAGIKGGWGYAVGAVGFVLAIGALIAMFADFGGRTSAQPAAPPQIIYTPAPPGTQLPSSPPATVPR
jgi:hypothetical protein